MKNNVKSIHKGGHEMAGSSSWSQSNSEVFKDENIDAHL